MKILILGGNGMIGHKMYQVLSKYYSDTYVSIRSYDTKYDHLFNRDKVIILNDASDFNNLNKLLNNLKPDVIINSIGITIRRGVNYNVSKTIAINSLLPHTLSNWCESNNKKLIHFSTDCVFNGTKQSYNQNDKPDAIDLYGKTKSLGELNNKHSLTLRGSMIGRELENKTELLEWFLNQKNESINGFDKVYYSGITTVRMANYILKILKTNMEMSGIYNVSSKPISKYELLKLFAIYFNINTQINIESNKQSSKVLESDLFFGTIKECQPDWNELIVELKNDCINNTELYEI